MNTHRVQFSLPEDCWEGIFQHLPLDDLFSLSTTCKTLHALAEPLLYREVSWKWSTTTPLRRLLCLLRSIFGRPDLAASVRHLSLLSASVPPWTNPEPDTNWDQESSCFTDVTTRAVEIIRQAGFSDEEEWIQSLQGGNFYALTSILISQLPRITSLRLDYCFVWMDGYPGRMVKHAILSPSNTLSTFGSLQVVDYGGNVPLAKMISFDTGDSMPDSYPASYNHSQFDCWFHLPSIRHLEIWLRDIAELKERPELDFNHLQTLILARSTILEEHVPFLLTRTKSLRNLHLGLAHRWRKQKIFQHSGLLAEALESVKDTVEKFSLGLEYYPCCFGEYHGDEEQDEWGEPLYGILQRFTHLQTAEIPISALLGCDPDYAYDLGDSILPDTLCELGLRNDLNNLYEYEWRESSILTCVGSFLAGHWRDSTPLLRKITIRQWDCTYIDRFSDQEKQLESACKEQGIDFDIVVDSLSSGLWSQTSSF